MQDLFKLNRMKEVKGYDDWWFWVSNCHSKTKKKVKNMWQRMGRHRLKTQTTKEIKEVI